MAPKRSLPEEQQQVIETLESLGFTPNVILLLKERISIEEEDQDISILYPYLPLLQELVKIIPVPHVAITLWSYARKLCMAS